MNKNGTNVIRGNITDWVKKHRKQLMISGVSIAVIGGVILGVKNQQSFIEHWNSRMKTVNKKGAIKVPDKNLGSGIETIISEKPAAKVIDLSAFTKTYSVPFEVSKHIRNLAEGMQASAEKIATALENGFELKPQQTWVDDYIKGATVA